MRHRRCRYHIFFPMCTYRWSIYSLALLCPSYLCWKLNYVLVKSIAHIIFVVFCKLNRTRRPHFLIIYLEWMYYEERPIFLYVFVYVTRDTILWDGLSVCGNKRGARGGEYFLLFYSADATFVLWFWIRFKNFQIVRRRPFYLHVN